MKNSLKIAKEDSNKVITLNLLSDETRKGNPELAIIISEDAIALSDKLSFLKGKAQALYSQGVNYYYKSSFDTALVFLCRSLKLSEENNFRNIKAGSLNNIGQINYYQGKYETALDYFLKSLNIRDTLNDKEGTAVTLNSIGLVYYIQEKYEEAKEYYFQSLAIRTKINDKQGIAQSMNSLGNATLAEGDFEKAKGYYQKGYDNMLEINDKNGMAYCLGNLGGVYGYQKKFDRALECFFQVLNIQREFGDKHGVSSALNNIGWAYAADKKYSKAIDNFSKSLKIAEQVKSKELMKYNYDGLSEVYTEIKDYKNAYEFHKLFSDIKDSMLNEESSKQIAEMQTKYESEKKQKEIELLNKEKELQDVEMEKKDAEVKKQNTQKIAFGAGFGLVLILALVIFRGLKQKQKANLLLAKQKQQIEIKNSHLEEANTEINKKKNEIVEKNHEILASIRYAQRIQEAILPPQKLVKSYLENSFVLYKPKDIVAGDFYWMHCCTDFKSVPVQILFACCDCTGHGVPGAFVSIVAHNALNRAVKEFGLIKPSEILDKVNELVEETFSKRENAMKDGMDIALCALEFPSPNSTSLSGKGKENEARVRLQYAGANNSMYIISNGDLKEIKADKQPIGHFIDRKPFTNQFLELAKGDCIYVFSDGYADQFGGPKGKKFKYSQFEKLLVSIHEKPMDEQKEILNGEIEKWKAWPTSEGGVQNLEQIDDICIIGVKV